MVHNWLPSFSSRVPITVIALCVPLSTSPLWGFFFSFFLVLFTISLHYCNSLKLERNKQLLFGWGGWKSSWFVLGNLRCVKRPHRNAACIPVSTPWAGFEEMALNGSVTSEWALACCPPTAGSLTAWGRNPEEGGGPSPTPVLPGRKSLVALGRPWECALEEQVGIFLIAWGWQRARTCVSYSFPDSRL